MYLANSIGIELDDGRMLVCVSKNTKVPVSKDQILKLNETNATISIYKGERSFVKDNVLIGKLSIHAPPFVIKIKFNIQEDGMMHVEVESNGYVYKIIEDIIELSHSKLKGYDDVDNILLDCDSIEKEILMSQLEALYTTLGMSFDKELLKMYSITELKSLLSNT